MLFKLNTQAFRDAIDKSGLRVSGPLIADGKLHRFYVEGDKSGSKNGWYVLYGDGLPAGSFGSWKTGQKGSWCAIDAKSLSPQECAEFRRRMEQARLTREAEGRARRQRAAEKAAAIFSASKLAPDFHPYLVSKGVRSHGVRLYKKSLVIPLHDISGELHSLQFIDNDGDKYFLSGGRKKGCYFAIGMVTESLCIAEGYATAASIYEATGVPVAAAFDAGNLKAVAVALRNKFPEMKITLCADNDAATLGNPGLTKAREAAACIGAYLAIPPSAGDFNDFLHQNSHEQS
ncbi:MAG: toprim domain-containing protein [Alphaproteobacteria bacterium]|nr:toprim domain-containing protein [Alphaproteobacteria bacterium]